MIPTFFCLIAWDWRADVEGIIVGAVTTAIGSVLLWGRRMSKLENSLASLGAELVVIKGELGARLTALEGTIGGKLTSLQSQVEVVPTRIASLTEIAEAQRGENSAQYGTLVATIENLARESVRVHEELRRHFADCNEHVIGPIKEKLKMVTDKLKVPA